MFDLNAGVGGTGSPGAVEADRNLSGALPGGGWELCLFFATSLSVCRAEPSSTTKSIPGYCERVRSKGLFLFLLFSVLLAMGSSVFFYFLIAEGISVL